MEKNIVTLIRPLFDPYVSDWQNYVSEFYYNELKSVDKTGSSSLDEGETDMFPQITFHKLNESWEVDQELVDRMINCLSENAVSPSDAIPALQQEASNLREMADGLLHNPMLEDAYLQAKTETWVEKLLDTNHLDVSAFHKELTITLSRAVFEGIEWHMAKTLDAVVDKL